VVVYQIVGVKNEWLDAINGCISNNCSTRLLVILGRRIMNQKFGDMYGKFLILFGIWTFIAFMFGIGY